MELKDDYFLWLLHFMGDVSKNYEKLLKKLYDTDFYYILDMDYNRIIDGIDLRYRYGYENNLSTNDILPLINKKCSILELMIALALRCEEAIMYDPDIGNRTELWFWDMIRSLNLFKMNDQNYNDIIVTDILDTFLKRKYKKNGNGSLFTTMSTNVDMRKIEIWYQMFEYLKKRGD